MDNRKERISKEVPEIVRAWLKSEGLLRHEEEVRVYVRLLPKNSSKQLTSSTLYGKRWRAERTGEAITADDWKKVLGFDLPEKPRAILIALHERNNKPSEAGIICSACEYLEFLNTFFSSRLHPYRVWGSSKRDYGISWNKKMICLVKVSNPKPR